MVKHGKAKTEVGYLPRKGCQIICVVGGVYQRIQKEDRESNRMIPEYFVQLLEKDASDRQMR